MRSFSADPSGDLIELTDLAQDPLPDIVRENLDHITAVVTWAKEYLCKPHPELGREGSVCPFVPLSMSKNLFFITIQQDHDVDSVYHTSIRYRDWFLEMEPRQGPEAQFKTIQILFPGIAPEKAPKIIDTIQLQLKSEFVSKGLMIGQFHQTPPTEPGLWNPMFRPLRSPVPLLSIRHMVPTDFMFLTKDKRYVTSYLEIHGRNIPRKQRALVQEVCQQFGIDLPEETA